jgi:predicted Rossmann-fold nucleotide-binding protein
MPSICVYCSSSNAIADVYPPVAEALGRKIARRGHEVLYGGGAVGLMGVMAEAAHEAGGTE